MTTTSRPSSPDDDDFLDGCDLSRNDRPTSDEDAPYVVLFCDCPDDDAIERRRIELRAMFGGA